jgi:hypothetical protein
MAAEAVDLDVHLQGGDAVAGAHHLEVHVAEVILVTEDVREDGDLVVLLDEAHGDAGDRLLEGHAGVHEGHRRRHTRRHRGRSIGFEDLAHDADGVVEVVLARHQVLDAAVGEVAVADLTPALPRSIFTSPVQNGGKL